MGLCASADEKDPADLRETYERVTPTPCPDVTPPQAMTLARARSDTAKQLPPQPHGRGHAGGVAFNNPGGRQKSLPMDVMAGPYAMAGLPPPRSAAHHAHPGMDMVESAGHQHQQQPQQQQLLRPPTLQTPVAADDADADIADAEGDAGGAAALSRAGSSVGAARRPRRGGRKAAASLILQKTGGATATAPPAPSALARRATYGTLPRARGQAATEAAAPLIVHPPITAGTKRYKRFAIERNLTVDLLCMGAAPGNPATCHAPPPQGTRPPQRPFAQAKGPPPPPAHVRYTKQPVAGGTGVPPHATTEFGMALLEKLKQKELAEKEKATVKMETGAQVAEVLEAEAPSQGAAAAGAAELETEGSSIGASVPGSAAASPMAATAAAPPAEVVDVTAVEVEVVEAPATAAAAGALPRAGSGRTGAPRASMRPRRTSSVHGARGAQAAGRRTELTTEELLRHV